MQESDFKAEIQAAEWIAAGIAEESIVIKAMGTLHRSQRNDVVEEKQDEDDTLMATERHVLFTSREGLYDMLPQSLFHQPTPPKNANEHEVLDYFKQHKQEEKNARLFFLPFETGINHARIFNALSELTLQRKGEDARLQNMFAHYWPIFRLLNKGQGAYFVKLLPVFHELRDNKEAIEEVMTVLLEVSVALQWKAEQPIYFDDIGVGGNFFGKRLGVNFIPGQAFHYEGEDKLLVCIGPIGKHDAGKYLQFANPQYQLLHALCDYLLPAHLDWELQFNFQEEEALMVLPGEQVKHDMILGVHTLLR